MRRGFRGLAKGTERQHCYYDHANMLLMSSLYVAQSTAVSLTKALACL